MTKAGRPQESPTSAGGRSTTEGCAPISFPVNPPNVLCNTMNTSPQTYQVNQGAFTYLLKHHGPLHGAMVYTNSTKSGAIAGQVLIEGPLHAGVKSDKTTGVGGQAQQSEFTPIIQQMKQNGSNFAYTVTSAAGAVELLSEAQLQGLTDPNILWTCTTACYDNTVTTNAGVMNGLYVSMTFLPFEEARANRRGRELREIRPPRQGEWIRRLRMERNVAFARQARPPRSSRETMA